ncbi:sensor domain-containing phosphodiesterase [Sphingomonas sp. M1-B02]|uniref:sensor domain-containing phosphodiesterase n=1 Tax=Sphingomonas sp. M1-B02 TaxID=3114300 RepID=UPI00223F8501|nr:EAL domain-containing protein [Sphingomonas sp. S6-11]UZK66146.1 EAL domain-containing protein [Sphingomonas sp. S6-11]
MPHPAQALADPIRDALLSASGDCPDSVVQRALRAVRSHLGLQVAYVSEIVGSESVFRSVDAPGLEHLIKPGDTRSLDDVYCRHILEGRLPQLIPDTAAEPLAMAMPITTAVPIGAHVSVPLRMADGHIYGMFCCLGPHADPSLNLRDLSMMRAFAELAAFEIDRERSLAQARRDITDRIGRIVANQSMRIVYQPIWNMEGTRPIGFECLARFPDLPVRSPDKWFAEAAESGMAIDLELAAIRAALAALTVLPDDVYLAVNASPSTALHPRLAALLAGYPLDRVVLEITEHDCVEDFEALTLAIAPLRAQGLRLAVDDAGAGYCGLQQILQMRPDLIKLDRSLIQDIGTDPSRRALAAALTMFARETGSRIVAEGVETEAELAMLRALGVHTVQGYLLGRPASLGKALAQVSRTGPSLAAV